MTLRVLPCLNSAYELLKTKLFDTKKHFNPLLQYVIERDGVTVERYGPQAGSFPGFQGIETHLQNCLNEN